MKAVEKSVIIPYEKYQHLLAIARDNHEHSDQLNQRGGQRDSSKTVRYEPYRRQRGPPGIPARDEI